MVHVFVLFEQYSLPHTQRGKYSSDFYYHSSALPLIDLHINGFIHHVFFVSHFSHSTWCFWDLFILFCVSVIPPFLLSRVKIVYTIYLSSLLFINIWVISSLTWLSLKLKGTFFYKSFCGHMLSLRCVWGGGKSTYLGVQFLGNR